MDATLEEVLREIKSLRKDLRKLKLVVDEVHSFHIEVEPTAEEVKAIKRGREEYRKGEYVKLSDLESMI